MILLQLSESQESFCDRRSNIDICDRKMHKKKIQWSLDGCLWYHTLNKISQEPLFFMTTSNLEHNLFRNKALILYQF